MINLIRNELSKIFHKKSIYIMLILLIIFIIIQNVIYKFRDDSFYYETKYEIERYEATIKDLDPNKPDEASTYASIKSELEASKLIEKYGDTYNWQIRVINNYIRPIIYSKNQFLYVEKNNKEYEKCQEEYENLIAKIDSGDWKYFVEKELKEVTEDLENIKNENTSDNKDSIYNLETTKQILEWRLEKNICFGDDYKNDCLQTWESARRQIANLNEDNVLDHQHKLSYNKALSDMEIRKYDIENEKSSGLKSDARGVLLNIFDNYEIFIIIISIMVAGSIVSEEFNKGTVKLLLIKPYKRTTILTAKFISSIIVLLIVILVTIIMQFIIGGITQGFNLYNTPAVVYNYNTSQLQEISIPNYLLMQTLGKLPMYILLMTLSFALSTLFVNSALSITIGILGYIAGPLVNQLATIYKLKFINYFVTPNWDLTQYLYGGIPTFDGINLTFSISIIICYMIIMLVPTYLTFKKRNIKNI